MSALRALAVSQAVELNAQELMLKVLELLPLGLLVSSFSKLFQIDQLGKDRRQREMVKPLPPKRTSNRSVMYM
ncbi:hypothetical protein G6L29_08550 [Agrobacterium rhizogenes]|uniref:hypothetical protein n=1 Tax=Rhizobium rhizogenes TaxID=359 RepID=UPI0015742C73|nr:hypothetical protein [Rhizobium rhizogenes]NTI15680.1 hypothetical protein [Rhizobium rhizogenes]